MQQILQGNVKGVKVGLTATNPNGEVIDIGEATSDLAGKFGKSWTPPIEGEYKIQATFEGSKSYGSLFDTTYIVVGQEAIQPSPTQGTTPTPKPTFTTQPTIPPQTPTESVPQTVPPTEPQPQNMYVIAGIAAIVIIAVIVSAIMMKSSENKNFE